MAKVKGEGLKYLKLKTARLSQSALVGFSLIPAKKERDPIPYEPEFYPSELEDSQRSTKETALSYVAHPKHQRERMP
ncbi:MAG: hypothetical protein LBE38_06245 [Deltaproteobacteria bacterium]|nr:hypothetical protein [Deltaproteobacteria bacterium]